MWDEPYLLFMRFHRHDSTKRRRDGSAAVHRLSMAQGEPITSSIASPVRRARRGPTRRARRLVRRRGVRDPSRPRTAGIALDACHRVDGRSGHHFDAGPHGTRSNATPSAGATSSTRRRRSPSRDAAATVAGVIDAADHIPPTTAHPRPDRRRSWIRHRSTRGAPDTRRGLGRRRSDRRCAAGSVGQGARLEAGAVRRCAEPSCHGPTVRCGRTLHLPGIPVR